MVSQVTFPESPGLSRGILPRPLPTAQVSTLSLKNLPEVTHVEYRTPLGFKPRAVSPHHPLDGPIPQRVGGGLHVTTAEQGRGGDWGEGEQVSSPSSDEGPELGRPVGVTASPAASTPWASRVTWCAFLIAQRLPPRAPLPPQQVLTTPQSPKPGPKPQAPA